MAMPRRINCIIHRALHSKSSSILHTLEKNCCDAGSSAHKSVSILSQTHNNLHNLNSSAASSLQNTLVLNKTLKAAKIQKKPSVEKRSKNATQEIGSEVIRFQTDFKDNNCQFKTQTPIKSPKSPHSQEEFKHSSPVEKRQPDGDLECHQ